MIKIEEIIKKSWMDEIWRDRVNGVLGKTKSWFEEYWKRRTERVKEEVEQIKGEARGYSY